MAAFGQKLVSTHRNGMKIVWEPNYASHQRNKLSTLTLRTQDTDPSIQPTNTQPCSTETSTTATTDTSADCPVHKQELKRSATQQELKKKRSSLASLRTLYNSNSNSKKDLDKKKSISSSIRSFFTGYSTPTTVATTRENSVETEPLTSIPPAQETPPSTVPGPATSAETANAGQTQTEVYPESHGKFQEEGVRSQPQEAHSYTPELPKKKEKHESRLHLRKKAALAWMAFKMKTKMHV